MSMPSSSKVKVPDRTRPSAKTTDRVRDIDYQALARFRYELRKFLAFSEAAAHGQNLTPQQHQALLTIKGFSLDNPVSVGDLAKLLFIRHHTAVELMDRMTRLGLIARVPDPGDGRRILIRLTTEGERRLRKLSKIHVEELSAVGGALTEMLRHFHQPKRP
jgi:DNA-binding MarR family transcriptional regulator